MMIKAPLVTIFDDFQQSRAKFENRMQREFHRFRISCKIKLASVRDVDFC